MKCIVSPLAILPLSVNVKVACPQPSKSVESFPKKPKSTVEDILTPELVKLFASKKTPESQTPSDASAMAIFMWYVSPHIT